MRPNFRRASMAGLGNAIAVASQEPRAIRTASWGWNNERVEILKKLWADGLSATQISDLIGAGLSRNAVIGKVHRLGLPGRSTKNGPKRGSKKSSMQFLLTRPSSVQRDPYPHKSNIILALMPKIKSEPFPEFEIDRQEGGYAFLDLPADGCKFYLGDPLTSDKFCGRKREPLRPYCPRHCARAYNGWKASSAYYEHLARREAA